MAVAAETWRRAFLVLLVVVLIGGPLVGIELFFGLRGTPELSARWIELAERCKTAVEQRQAYDTSGLSEHHDRDDAGNNDYWLDEKYQLEVTFHNLATGAFRSCTVHRPFNLPVADVRAHEIVFAFMQLRSASIRSGKYAGYEPAPLPVADGVIAAFETGTPDQFGCVVRSLIFAVPEDHQLLWDIGDAPSTPESGATCL